MKLLLLVLLMSASSSLIAQTNDRGYISMTLSERTIRIPLEWISYDDRDCAFRAFGKISDPTCTTVMMSIAFHELSTELSDLNADQSWLSIDHSDKDRNDFYLSCGFQDTIAYCSIKDQPCASVRKTLDRPTALHISSVERQYDRLIISGDFTARSADSFAGHGKNIEIQNGHFTFIADMENDTTQVTDSTPMPGNSVQPEKHHAEPPSSDINLPSPSTLFQSEPLSSTLVDEEQESAAPFSSPIQTQPAPDDPIPQPIPSPPEDHPQAPGVPIPAPVQPPPDDATPQREDGQRTTRTGRTSLLTHPDEPSRVSPGRSDQQPGVNSEPIPRTRDTGVRRGR